MGEERASLHRRLRVPEARRGTSTRRAVFGVVDLETTGLSTDDHLILEIGLVVQCGGRVVRRFSTLVDVPAPIPRSIVALTGISRRDLEGAPGEEAALRAFAEVVRSEGVQALVAHNAPFDRRFLERAWARYPLAMDLPPFLCSLRLARRWIRAPRHGLDALVAQLGIRGQARHRALGDAEMTSALWTELLARARLRGIHSLEDLRSAGEPGRSGPRRRRVTPPSASA
ncbi:MAG: 3'-5' exonuclease [Deltaproteobacteria bacterium]|nr:3'-5' exonuclease [Deltaproteobacteria bacterium]MBW2414056.1 3'-5' exonuclease [Deltaproteobacteria bacterium]